MNGQFMRYTSYVYMLVLGALLTACSSTKYVPEGSYLLDKVEVRTDGSYNDINLGLIGSYVRQQPNSRWFSSWKLPLSTYSLSGRDSTKWLNRVLRSMGEAPVVYDSIQAKQSLNDLRSELQNQGYLSARVSMDTVCKKKKLKAVYTLHPGTPYVIENIQYDIRDNEIERLLSLNDTANWGIRPGNRFRVSALDAERKRIANILQNSGYYNFNKDYISYVADTVSGSRGISLRLILHPYTINNNKDTLHTCYTIGSITYSSNNGGEETIPLRSKVLRANTFITEGMPYSAENLQRTYNHFGRLGAVRYTNIGFTQRPGEPVLDCNMQVIPAKPNTLTFLPEGTNTAGDLGAAVSLTYQNRNIFRGSELLNIELRGAFEAIKGLEGYNNDNFEEYSVEAGLTFPRFIFPFLSNSFRRRITATSEVSLIYNLQNRPEYHRRVLTAAWRYKWGDRRHHDRYQIDLLEINYVSMPWISDKFREDYLDDVDSRNVILRYNYEDLFIMKFGVGYTYNNGRYAIRASAETAGNFLSLASSVFGHGTNSLGQRQVFRIAYAQYFKTDFSYTRNFKTSYNSMLVFHTNLGVAYPYGNSTVLPFEKRYFTGGANFVRGWSVRELGPGRYSTEGRGIDFINQTGDIKFTMNLEYRANIFWKLEGAMFLDAGNVWTLRNYADQPGGQFKFDEFWKEIAVAYGLGLRLNIDYFVLRFDFGMKAINPAFVDTREQFPIISPKLSRDLTFHFAVGYPF